MNRNLQYDLLWSSNSPSSKKHSLQFPQINVSGLPIWKEKDKKKMEIVWLRICIFYKHISNYNYFKVCVIEYECNVT